MKNVVKFTCIIAVVILFSACEKEDINEVSSRVSIQVQNLKGEIQSDVTVYMFDVDKSSTFGGSPMFAVKSVVTDVRGNATFELQEFNHLNYFDTQTTLYFRVFKGVENKIIGETGVTIMANETKLGTIKLIE